MHVITTGLHVRVYVCVCVYASRDHLPYCFLSWTSPRLFLRTRSMYNFRSVHYSTRVSLLDYYAEMKIAIVNARKIRKVAWQLVDSNNSSTGIRSMVT